MPCELCFRAAGAARKSKTPKIRDFERQELDEISTGDSCRPALSTGLGFTKN